MLELKTYSTDELCEVMSIKKSSFKNHKDFYEEKLAKDYIWSKEKIGRKIYYKIEDYNSESITPLINTFYSLLEGFSGQDVYFKNPETAIKILYYLYQRNENVAVFISKDLGIAESTVRDYIKRFRKLGLLVGYWDCFIIDENKVEKHVLSHTQYDYYQVVDGKWHETNLNGWQAAWDFKRNAYIQYVEEIESETGWNITDDEEKVAKLLSNKMMIEEFGEQRRISHKYLNEDAKIYLGSFLVYAAKELGLSFEKREMKSDEYVSNLYKKPFSLRNASDTLVLGKSYKVVDVGRNHVGDFEEWLLQQKEKQMEQASFQVGFMSNNGKTDEGVKVMSFKQFTLSHEYMKVQEVVEIIEDEVEDMNNNLRIEEDPFTGQLEVFNEQTLKWEKYIEGEWVNGEKIEKVSFVMAELPRIKHIVKSSAIEEMFSSLI